MGQDEKPYEYAKDWKIHSTSKEELKELLIGIGEVTIRSDAITFSNYPFEPSLAFRQNEIKVTDIADIDLKSYPPTIRIGDELLFISGKYIERLKQFATENKIKTVDRPNLWSWILEPFLDTEFTYEYENQINNWLAEYGLLPDKIFEFRKEVETQMLKYNFDTMLWEWTLFSALDVLLAMRPKYKQEEFREFYKKVMMIELLNKKQTV